MNRGERGGFPTKKDECDLDGSFKMMKKKGEEDKNESWGNEEGKRQAEGEQTALEKLDSRSIVASLYRRG